MLILVAAWFGLTPERIGLTPGRELLLRVRVEYRLLELESADYRTRLAAAHALRSLPGSRRAEAALLDHALDVRESTGVSDECLLSLGEVGTDWTLRRAQQVSPFDPDAEVLHTDLGDTLARIRERLEVGNRQTGPSHH